MPPYILAGTAIMMCVGPSVEDSRRGRKADIQDKGPEGVALLLPRFHAVFKTL